MVNVKNLYLIRSYEKDDSFFLKNVRQIYENFGLSALFSSSFEKFPLVREYCFAHNIETIEVPSFESRDYLLSILEFSLNQENKRKKNLAALIHEIKTVSLEWALKFDPHFKTKSIVS